MSQKVDILGIKIDNIDMQEAKAKFEKMLEGKKQYDIFTPNPEIIWAARQSVAFARILNSADMLLPDGIGVVMAAKILNTPLKERVAGFDFLMEVFQIAQDKKEKVFLFGGKDGVAERAAKELETNFPDLIISGTHSGYFDNNDSANIVQKINHSGANILVVCLGAPKQERWIASNRAELSPIVTIGAGGALDVIAGNVTRAPKIFQKLGLEWFFRAMREPKRIPRLFVLPKFIKEVKKVARGQK